MPPRSAFVWVSCVTAALAVPHAIAAVAEPATAMETGIVVDRLSLEELGQWRSIERLVTAAKAIAGKFVIERSIDTTLGTSG